MRWNVRVDQPIEFAGDWEADLRGAAEREGLSAGHWALDYFVFPRALSLDIPPLAVGRPTWDDWMVYGARAARIPVIDLSDVLKMVIALLDRFTTAVARRSFDGCDVG